MHLLLQLRIPFLYTHAVMHQNQCYYDHYLQNFAVLGTGTGHATWTPMSLNMTISCKRTGKGMIVLKEGEGLEQYLIIWKGSTRKDTTKSFMLLNFWSHGSISHAFLKLCHET